MHHSTANQPWHFRATIALILASCSASALADSAIPLLSGFDQQRLEASYPPADEASLGELAKLVYRLRTLDTRSLTRLAGPADQATVGDALAVQGNIVSIQTLPVPSDLVEFLEFSRLHLIDIENEQQVYRMVSSSLPAKAVTGDRISAVGVVLESTPASEPGKRGTLVAACAAVNWFPQGPLHAGQQVLQESGFELSLLSDLVSRNRRPLVAEDGDAFYSMLAAASSIGQRDDVPAPLLADPVALLREPQEMVSQWIRMELESVQVTRVAVTEPMRQQQLGSDHYYQIDAVGDLGGVVIKIENLEPGVPPATFQSRYPVSLVIRDLPDFLAQRIRQQQGGDAIVAPIRIKFSVDGFFFRLWGYESEFMKQHGGGQQFGPLVVAARLQNQEPEGTDPIGVGSIGIVAAIVVVCGIFGIWWWQRRLTASDAAARRRRQQQEASQVQFPDERLADERLAEEQVAGDQIADESSRD